MKYLCEFSSKIPEHVYIRGIGGIFYNTADFILYTTLFFILARKYEIRILAFCLMFNHIHSLQKASSFEEFAAFNDLVNFSFSRVYNKEYGRKGSLFKRPFGHSGKKVTKKIRECFTYIANNPVAGKLCSKTTDYRWTLLAYLENKNPFSEPLNKRKARRYMKSALNEVDSMYRNNKYLNYSFQERIFSRLNNEESKQLTDYILYKYNFLDRTAIVEYFGSFQNAFSFIDMTAGSEHDLPDDYDNYSIYRKMIEITRAEGITNIHLLNTHTKSNLADTIRKRTGADKRQISKFLHL